ncbi:serine/threonine-protein kinase [Paraliomyxa miuraensis]|uniref:serine/threonine-protein kinase n=1 Tax=Paraliomyxa miuraensis TaxID=376150 RepID=UPI0022549A97|nr:serine/threonine-protein kinase [Paraliomyxa miuraensis]MCX4246187.1 serine/threonine protein kinase [Paraliomyxa miuraensis]
MSSPSTRTVVDRWPAPDPPAIPHVGMDIAGRYRLVERRGRGGIGEVWEAIHSPTGRRVAIKLLLPAWQTDQNVRKRFVREGRLASTMQHRNIVAIHEAGEADDGQPYIAMELLEGPSLDVEIQRSGPMPWDRVKRILLQLCSALDHAHALGIVHRDVKPSNVMLARRLGDPDRCKLLDFGIAKQSLVSQQTSHLTAEGQMLGSPGFMSPEQLQGRPTDLRGDIYGLGCTGFYLLTGRVPFAGGSVPEMVHNALYHSPRPLEDVNIEEPLRQRIEALFHRAIHRDPAQRFDSILDFVVALNHVDTSDKPIQRWVSLQATATGKPAVGLEPTLETKPAPTAETEAIATTEGPIEVANLDATTRNPTPVRLGLMSTLGHSWMLTGRTTVDRSTWAGAEGYLEIARVPPDVVLVHMSGTLEPAAATPFLEHLPELLERHQPCHVFWHMGSIKSYPSSVRDAVLQALTEHRDCIESVHVLNGPGLVGMAVSLATVALGSQRYVYEDQPSWRAALDALFLRYRE